MAIVASVIESKLLQKDGRSWVHEAHTDHVANKYMRGYLADAGLDTDAGLAAYAVQLTADLTAAEIAANITSIAAFGSLATTTIVQSTLAANFVALRTAYQTATRVDAVMMGDFLSSLTNAQLQAAFGFTAGQVTTLRANKLTPAANLAASIRATVGQ
jgi:hypothetical protein